jgi:hypothetical protein
LAQDMAEQRHVHAVVSLLGATGAAGSSSA